MFLTKFPLNMTRRATRSMLASPYRLHAAIAGSFPTACSNEQMTGRVLWRIDRLRSGDVVLYIVSPSKPSLVGLDEQIGFPDLEPQWLTRDYDSLLDSLKDGQMYAFRLVANPVVSRKSCCNEKGGSKRLPHLTVLQQAAWLAGKDAFVGAGVAVPDLFANQQQSRAERNGFRICANEPCGSLSLVVSDSQKVSFKRADGERPVTLAMARYDGILEVVDAELLRHALKFGIGHAKSFGCGLMTLAPCGNRL